MWTLTISWGSVEPVCLTCGLNVCCHCVLLFSLCPHLKVHHGSVGALIFLWDQLVYWVVEKIHMSEFELLPHQYCKYQHLSWVGLFMSKCCLYKMGNLNKICVCVQLNTLLSVHGRWVPSRGSGSTLEALSVKHTDLLHNKVLGQFHFTSFFSSFFFFTLSNSRKRPEQTWCDFLHQDLSQNYIYSY